MQKYAKSSWISKLHLHLAKNQAFYRSRSGHFAFYFFKKSQEKAPDFTLKNESDSFFIVNGNRKILQL